MEIVAENTSTPQNALQLLIAPLRSFAGKSAVATPNHLLLQVVQENQSFLQQMAAAAAAAAAAASATKDEKVVQAVNNKENVINN
jgi:hypothetical protein